MGTIRDFMVILLATGSISKCCLHCTFLSTMPSHFHQILVALMECLLGPAQAVHELQEPISTENQE